MCPAHGDESVEPQDDPVLRDLGRAYAHAVLVGDEIAAEVAVREAVAGNFSVAEIDDEIIAPALWLVGRLWARGEISVADEHFATEISLRVMVLLRELRRTVTARHRSRVLLAAPQGEHHVVALQMVDAVLREAGYPVLMLGADLPPRELARACERHTPDVVGLTVTMAASAARVSDALEAVRRTRPHTGWVLGGRGVPRAFGRSPGVEVCARVADAVEAVDALVKRAGVN